MRELFLHIGMHKTGTSSIQQTLHGSAELLQAHGIAWFPAAEPNHSRTVVSAFTAEPHRYPVNRRLGLHEPDAAARYAEACRDRLSAFLSDAPGPRLVVSGEGIGMLAPDGIARMLAAFRPLVDRITVIGFVRPPRSYIASAIRQRITDGATLATLRRRPVVPRYRGRFAPFLGAPDVDAVRLLPFTPARLLGGCSVATFLDAIGAPGTLHGRLPVLRANSGGSHLGGVLALAANEAVPIFLDDGAANPGRSARLARLLDDLPGSPFAVPEPLVALGLAASADDIAWMERRLGAPFDAAEKTAASDGAAEPRPLDATEVRQLVLALNALLLATQPAGAGPATATRRPREGPMPDRPTPDGPPRRAARLRALRGRP